MNPMGIDDIIKLVTKRINGGESLNDAAKLYDSAKALADSIEKQNKVNPIIQGLEEQFDDNSAKLLTIQNYEKLKGLRFGGEYQVKSAHESMGNYTFMVQNLRRPSPQNEELFRLRRVPEVKGFRMYRLTLQNRRNFVTLPIKAIQNPALLLQEMYELTLKESNPF